MKHEVISEHLKQHLRMLVQEQLWNQAHREIKDCWGSICMGELDYRLSALLPLQLRLQAEDLVYRIKNEIHTNN